MRAKALGPKQNPHVTHVKHESGGSWVGGFGCCKTKLKTLSSETQEQIVGARESLNRRWRNPAK